MDVSKLQQLKRQRAELVERMGQLITTASEADRGLSGEEREQWERMHAETEEMRGRIEPMEAQWALEHEESRSAGAVGAGDSTGEAGDSTGEAGDSSEQDNGQRVLRAWEGYLRFGMQALTPEARALVDARFHEFERREASAVRRALVQEGVLSESRAQQAGVLAAGGYTVPEGAMQPLEEARKAWGGIRRSRAEVMVTADGTTMPIPTDDDTANVAVIVGEGQEAGEQDVALAQVSIGAFIYTTQFIRASRVYIQDSSTDVVGWIGRKFGRRFGAGQNAHNTTGTGTGQPEGVLTGATQGKVAALATAFTFPELQDLKHDVDPAYRQPGVPEWMWNDSTLLAIKKLADTTDRPLWQAGIAVGQPDTLDGDPWVVNQDMPSVAAGTKPILYGDFSTFKLRDVDGTVVLRLEERFAEFFEIGFIAFHRHDSRMVDAGQNPIKYLEMAP